MVRYVLAFVGCFALMMSEDVEAGQRRPCKISMDASHSSTPGCSVGVSFQSVDNQTQCDNAAATFFGGCDLDANPAPAETFPRRVKAELIHPSDTTQRAASCVATQPSGSTCSTIYAPDPPDPGIALGEPLVGVIRFDNWYEGSSERDLLKYASGTDNWQVRLPFYTRIDGSAPPLSALPLPPSQFPFSPTSLDFASDRQSVMDEEIKFASSGGLDYFTFLWQSPYAWNQNSTPCPLADDVPDTPNDVTPPVSGPLDPAIHWKNRVAFDRSLQLYLTSTWNDRMGFAIVMNWERFGPSCPFRAADTVFNTAMVDLLFNDEDPLSSWFETYLEQWIELAKHGQYQKVRGDRPIIYLTNLQKRDNTVTQLDSLAAYFWPVEIGIPANASDRTWAHSRVRLAIQKIRERFIEEGLGNPFIVGMFPFVSLTNPHPDEVQFLSDVWGLDATSRYARVLDQTHNYGPAPAPPTTVIGSATGTNNHSDPSYLGLPYLVDGNPAAPSVFNRWVQFRDLLIPKNKQIVPPMMAGLDFRPRLIPSVNAVTWEPNHNWAVFVSRGAGDSIGAQIADHLDDLLTWVKTNAHLAEANSVILYAWNELTEGGWIVPTLSEGDERLDRIRETICAPVPGAPPTPPKTCKRLPVGLVDAVAGGIASGWAYDPDKPSRSIRVDFYANAPYHDNPNISGILIGSVQANQLDASVNASQGIVGKHRFVFTIPKQYFKSQIYAHAIDPVRFSENPGILHAGSASFEHPFECDDDDIDNDGDGLADENDPQCNSPSDKTETADCSDGIDNDGDGLIDYAGLPLVQGPDPNCGTWGFGYEGDTLATNCNDGIDNDGDGLADTNGVTSPASGFQPDSGCTSSGDITE